jgi:hypothetical protein
MSFSAPSNSHRRDRSPALKWQWRHFQNGQLVNSPIDAHIDPHHKGLTKANRSANNLVSKQHMGGYKHGV